MHEGYKEFSKGTNQTMGVDFFMGNKDFLGKGFSKIIMNKFIELHCHDASRVIVDPNPKNSKAIHVYVSCGFTLLKTCIIDNEMHDIMVYDK